MNYSKMSATLCAVHKMIEISLDYGFKETENQY